MLWARAYGEQGERARCEREPPGVRVHFGDGGSGGGSLTSVVLTPETEEGGRGTRLGHKI